MIISIDSVTKLCLRFTNTCTMPNEREMSDEELVNVLREGNNLDAAISQVYRSFFQLLTVFIIKNGGSRQDAEDMFQDSLITLIGAVQAGKFRGESSLGTFLFAINRNLWLNELKKRGRAEKREALFAMDNPAEDAGVDKLIVLNEARKMFAKAIETLGETCKRLLMMFYFEKKSYSEMLSELNYSNEQVMRNKKYKCMKQLESYIQKNPQLKKNLKDIFHG